MTRITRNIVLLVAVSMCLIACSSSQDAPDDDTVKEQWTACFLNIPVVFSKVRDFARVTDIKVIDRMVKDKQATVIVEATVELTQVGGRKHPTVSGWLTNYECRR